MERKYVYVSVALLAALWVSTAQGNGYAGRAVNGVYYKNGVVQPDNVINVKAPPYNAVGDGVNDDTAELQAALDYMHTNGGRVFVPAGVYKITSALTYTSTALGVPAFQLVGVGKGSVINQATTDLNALTVGSTDYELNGWYIGHISINSVAKTAGTPSVIALIGCHRGTMEDVEIYRGGYNGIAVSGCLQSLFRNVRVSSNLYNAAQSWAGDTGPLNALMTFTRNTIAGAGVSCNGTTLLNCELAGGGAYGLYYVDTNSEGGVLVDGCTIQGTFTTAGAYISGTAQPVKFNRCHLEVTQQKQTDGTFAADLSNWQAGANWSWEDRLAGGGFARHTAGSVETLAQASCTTVAGANFVIVYDVNDMSAGTLTPSFGGITATGTSVATATGSYTFSGIAADGTALVFTPNNDFNGRILSVVVTAYENAKGDAVVVDSSNVDFDSCNGTRIYLDNGDHCAIRNSYINRIDVDADSEGTQILDGRVYGSAYQYVVDRGVSTKIVDTAWASGTTFAGMRNAHTRNLFVNPGLEAWDSATQPAGVLLNATATLAQETTIIRSGIYSLKVTGSADAKSGIMIRIPQTLAGQWITVEYWLYVTAGDSVTADVSIDSDNEVVSLAPYFGTGAWEHHIYSFNNFTGGGADTTCYLRIYVGANTDIFYVDDIGVYGSYEPPAGIVTFPDDDTRTHPDVSWSHLTGLFKATNAAPATITDFDNGHVGQVITVLAGNGNTTLDFSANANMVGNAGVDFTMGTDDAVQLVYDGAKWTAFVSDQ